MFFSRKSEDFAVFDWNFDGHRLIGNINLALRSYRGEVPETLGSLASPPHFPIPRRKVCPQEERLRN